VLKRIEEDRGDSVPDPLTFRKIVRHLGDWTSWAYGKKFRPDEKRACFKCCQGVMFACSSLPAC
jgi:hypothetical protein